MNATLSSYLLEDHARLGELLDRSVAEPDRFDHVAFEEFRGGLLRHIAIEEKILLSAVRRKNGGIPLPLALPLRVEHAALASLLVPSPDAALVGELRRVLEQHNPREEGPEGLYAICEERCGSEVAALIAQARAMPAVRTAPHQDGPGVIRTAAAALLSAAHIANAPKNARGHSK